MIKARVLNGNSIARLNTSYNFATYHDVAMTRFGGHYLIYALAISTRQTNNVTSLCKVKGIAAITISGNAICGETRIRSSIGADNWACQCDTAHSFWCEGIVEAILSI